MSRKIKKMTALASAVALCGMCMLTSIGGITASAAPKARVSVHDPSIFKDKSGTYYVFGSHIEAAKTNDLQNWTRFTNGYATTNNAIFGNLSQNLADAFAWAGEDLEDCEGGFSVWAPDVIYNPDYVNKDGSKGAYMMYFCTTSTYMRSVIAYGVSQNPEGPYEFVDTLIYSGFTSNDSYATSSTKNVNRKYTSTNIDELITAGEVTYNNDWFSNSNFNNYTYPNAIDPTIYYEPDGTMYMCYGSWSGGIFTLEIDPATGRCIHPKSGTTSDGRIIDSYFGTKISGGCFKSGEGPFMEYNPETGYYYLWVTYGGLTAQGGYNMRVFRSTNPDGPFYDAAGNPAVVGGNTNIDTIGLKVMGNYQFSCLDTAYMACGHNSVLRDDDGRWYLFYHARFNWGNEFHEVRVHEMQFSEDGWPVVAPFEYSGDVPSEYGYNPEDIVGAYEFINHGTDTSATIHAYEKINLNADGTISGAQSGSWSQAEDSAYATITIGGQTYHGHFLAAQDEKGKRVMSFTAVGNNNQTVWGAKTSAYTGTNRAPLTDMTNPDSSLIYNEKSAQGYGESIYIGDTELLSGVSYTIANKYSGLLLEAADGKMEANTNIQQWTKNGYSNQEWRIVDAGNGYCKVLSLSDESMCMAVESVSAENGVNVSLQKYTGADNQLWKLKKSGMYYGIVSKCSGDTAGLDVYDWSNEAGGNINQWEYWEGDCQLWKIDAVRPMVNTGKYTVRNLNSGYFIADKHGNAVQSAAQNWIFTRLEDGTYTIETEDGLALTVDGSSAEDGTNISLSAKTGDVSQKFTLLCNRDGSYALLTAASEGKSCADVFEISLDDGANICQWNYWGGDGQKFILEPSKAEIPEQPKKIIGDVNADGAFTMLDVVMMQKYLLNMSALTDMQAGDVSSDGRINIFDLNVMKQMMRSVK